MLCVINNLMIRTQVYLTEEQAHDIKVRAQRERRREADILRELVDRGRLTSQGKKQESLGQALLRFATRTKKLGMTGPTDLSTNHDDYLYGDK
jgi:hypothetical protein